MNRVQTAIFPGIILASIAIIFLTHLISTPGEVVQASNENLITQSSISNEQSSNEQNISDCSLGSSYPEKVRQWCSLIESAGEKHGLDSNLLAALILQESGGNPDAYSHSGAVGLMQVMPRDGLAADFMCLNGPCFASRPASSELYDPQFNIDYGVNLLAGLVRKTGDIREALRLYGPMDYGYAYADKVLAIADRYR